MSRLLVVFVFIISVWSTRAQFTVPPVSIQALEPSGLRVSIPDLQGIKLFGFHARINEPVGDKEDGTISGDVKQASNERWVFESPDISLSKNDIIYYWIFVQYENLGFRKDGQSFTVTQFFPKNTPFPSMNNKTPTCTTSKTTTSLQGTVCKNKLIFEDEFKNGIDSSKWNIEHRFPSDQQENEFVSFQKSNVKSANERVEITPTLQLNEPDWNPERIEGDTLNLGTECTGIQNSIECESSDTNIVPPVISGKITTKKKFTFKYGKIEIRAKLPIGDWIYPELYLEPATSEYGKENYNSGVIRIAFARGNNRFEVNGQDLGNKLLSGGAVLANDEYCRNKYIRTKTASSPWSQDFHTYGLIWDSDKITLQVDGQSYGEITGKFSEPDNRCPKLINPATLWKNGEQLAPFDQQFYISLGIGVGGIADFPNVPIGKPWKNEQSKARKNFWQSYGTWYNQWSDVNKKLIIDYVKVWAI